MAEDDLEQRLRAISTSGDHARGCQGREYTCTCGYDDRWESLTTEAADRLKRYREALGTVQAWFDR